GSRSRGPSVVHRHVAAVNALLPKAADDALAKEVTADTADQRHGCPKAASHHGLVGSFAAVADVESPAGPRLPGTGPPGGAEGQVHGGRTGHADLGRRASHGISRREKGPGVPVIIEAWPGHSIFFG